MLLYIWFWAVNTTTHGCEPLSLGQIGPQNEVKTNEDLFALGTQYFSGPGSGGKYQPITGDGIKLNEYVQYESVIFFFCQVYNHKSFFYNYITDNFLIFQVVLWST